MSGSVVNVGKKVKVAESGSSDVNMVTISWQCPRNPRQVQGQLHLPDYVLADTALRLGALATSLGPAKLVAHWPTVLVAIEYYCCYTL